MTDASPFLTLPGAVDSEGPDAGVPAHYGNPVTEQRELEAGRAIVDLSNRSVLSITGPDRLSWLNSITSQNLLGLAAGESSETLLLDATGRLEHAVRVIEDGETLWLLVERAEADGLARLAAEHAFHAAGRTRRPHGRPRDDRLPAARRRCPSRRRTECRWSGTTRGAR